MSKQPICDFYVLTITDYDGAKCRTVTDDLDPAIWMAGRTSIGAWVQFEGYPEELKAWAEYYGFGYTKHGHNYSDLGHPVVHYND
jgi:hypothetical protein